MAEPFSPVIHSDPSLSDGCRNSLDKPIVVGFGNEFVLIQRGTAFGGFKKKGLFFLLSDRLMKVEQPLTGGETEGIAVEAL